MRWEKDDFFTQVFKTFLSNKKFLKRNRWCLKKTLSEKWFFIKVFYFDQLFLVERFKQLFYVGNPCLVSIRASIKRIFEVFLENEILWGLKKNNENELNTITCYKNFWSASHKSINLWIKKLIKFGPTVVIFFNLNSSTF